MTESPDIQYGRLLEAAEISGYAAHRAFEVTRGLLESGEWAKVGPGFEDVSAFVRSVPFGTLNPPEELRRSYEAIAHQHGASKRAIADSAGVSEFTVRQDLKSGAMDIAPTDESPSSEQEKYDDPVGDDAIDIALDDALEDLPVADHEYGAGEFRPDEVLDDWTEDEPDPAPWAKPEPVMLTLRTHTGEEVLYPQPASRATFNETTGEGISWAAWSWNPVTGCLHGCDYCYARAIAHRFTEGFPVGFTPLFHHERLEAPTNTTIPARFSDRSHKSCGIGDCQICAHRRVFVCSMADLYGRWVPDEWIDQVHASMLAAPWWEYLLLTKFPSRYVGLDLPPNAWVGTSVDEQKRVRIAEDAFRKIDGVKWKWLSLEPLREPLEFSDFSMFDWVVIGAQTETRQPDGIVEAFAPPWEWVCRITAQAKEAGCRVHWKPNLLNGRPGTPLDEYPGG